MAFADWSKIRTRFIILFQAISNNFHIIAITTMRESKFVEQNKEKWAQFEQDLKEKKDDAHLLRSQLIEITDDLSYSRTFYRNRSVRIYLNGLGQQVYNNIYKNKKNFTKTLKSFYTEEIPRILYFCRKELLVSFLVLLASVAIGIFSSAKDEGFARSILGDGYVEMTLENIKNGDPMAVYKSSSQMSMFVQIAKNNLWVSLMVFMAGLIASYGALVIMVRNGIMLGVFIYFFYSRNLVSEFNLTVWMHGTIEILTLVVETVAGMLLGRGLVYPGTLSRMKAFSVWGRRGAMLFLSTVPFIVFAAFIESFLTRHTEMSDLVRLLLILLSLAVMVFYFVVFPFAKFRHYQDTELGMPELRPETSPVFEKYNIQSSGQIFLKSIELIGLHFHRILRTCFLFSLIYFLLFYLYQNEILMQGFKLLEVNIEEAIFLKINKFVDMYGNLGLLFNARSTLIGYLISSCWQAAILYYSFQLFSKSSGIKIQDRKRDLIISVISVLALNLLSFGKTGFLTFVFIIVSPYLLIMLSSWVFEREKSSFRIGNKRVLGVLFLYLLALFLGMVLVLSPLSYLIIWMMELNVELTPEAYQTALKCLMMFAFVFLSSFCLLFYIIQCIYLSYTLAEINGAKGLMQKISTMGKSKKAYGIETE